MYYIIQNDHTLGKLIIKIVYSLYLWYKSICIYYCSCVCQIYITQFYDINLLPPIVFFNNCTSIYLHAEWLVLEPFNNHILIFYFIFSTGEFTNVCTCYVDYDRKVFPLYSCLFRYCREYGKESKELMRK